MKFGCIAIAPTRFFKEKLVDAWQSDKLGFQ